MLEPIFARPENVLTFSGESAFIALLQKYSIPYDDWTDENKARAWKEILDGDAVYALGDSINYPSKLIRFIVTVSIRVVMRHPALGFLVLIEYAREADKDGRQWLMPRRHKDSSLSEKIHVDSMTGELRERPIDAIIRCLREESKISITERVAAQGLTFMPWHEQPPGFNLPRSEHVELDFKETTKKFPKLPTHNQVAHYVLDLPHVHYRRKHRDDATRYHAKWKSTHFSMPIEPILLRLP